VRLADAETASNLRPPCKTGIVLSKLDKEDTATFVRWLDEQRSPFWIAKVFAKAGVHVNQTTIRTHLRGFCRCDDDVPFKGAEEWQG